MAAICNVTVARTQTVSLSHRHTKPVSIRMYAQHHEPHTDGYPAKSGAQAAPTYTYDVEAANMDDKPPVMVPAEGYASFANKIVRQGFIRKVFGACSWISAKFCLKYHRNTHKI